MSSGCAFYVNPESLLFHVTDDRGLDAILKEGIRPQVRSAWTGAYGQEIKKPGYIYAFSTLNDALAFTGRKVWDGSSTAIVVVFEDSLQDWEKDPHWESVGAMGNWLMKRGSISFDQVIDAIPVSSDSIGLFRRIAFSAGKDPEELTYAEYLEGVGMKWNPR